MKIIIDSREHEGKNEHVLQYFRDNGIEYINKERYGSIALKVGDYMSDENKNLSIDRKQSMIELVGNICQQHDRFQREMLRAKELGIKLVILIEHGRGRKNFGRRFLTQHVTGHPGVPLDEPIRTITTKDQWALVDGDIYRPLTVRETARAMGFPDSYRWPDGSSRRDCMTGLGNAVCPPVAKALIERVKEAA